MAIQTGKRVNQSQTAALLKARKSQISLLDTPYYHCVSRFVRRAFLCGEVNGRSFEHSRQWVEDRIHVLSEVFAIDVCAYTVMSNHTHLVLHVAREKADALSTEEMIQRWRKLNKGPLLSQRYITPDLRKDLHETQIKTVELTAEIWRKRLFDISWFMRALNEYIARAANKEDDCTGHFWEGRFKSQALLDESALAAFMAYVDLIPVRAKMANTRERLMLFAGNPRQEMPHGLPFTLPDYLQLVDITSRYIHPNKRGKVEHSLPTILERLNIEHEHWLTLTTQFETCFKLSAGKVIHLEQYAHNQHQQRVQGRQSAKRLLG
jgi:REP element-mobilizing transposase RayT